MTAAALLALGSAVLHAVWNLIVKSGRDPFVSTWAVFASSTFVAVPVVLLMGWPSFETWPFLVASSVLQVVYAFTLSSAYRHADLSVAYPVARGLAPLLITVGAAFVLEDTLGPAGFAGIVAISVSLLLIARGSKAPRGVAFAVATGVVISLYTLVDTAGVRKADESVRYVAGVFVISAVLLTVAVLVARSAAAISDLVGEGGWRMAISGALAAGAYGLVLTAARFGPIGLVAGLRETSVIFGGLAGWLILGERLGSRRTLAAAGVAFGAVLLMVR